MAYAFRPATTDDTQILLTIYATARAYQKQTGNPHQWPDYYPGLEDIQSDIAQEALNVVINTDTDEIVGAFSVFAGPDPTYQTIEGAWCNDRPYIVAHRVAVAKPHAGIGRSILRMLKQARSDIRIDTHYDNAPMRGLLASEDFVETGTIYLASGDPRVAYHYVYPQTHET